MAKWLDHKHFILCRNTSNCLSLCHALHLSSLLLIPRHNQVLFLFSNSCDVIHYVISWFPVYNADIGLQQLRTPIGYHNSYSNFWTTQYKFIGKYFNHNMTSLRVSLLSISFRGFGPHRFELLHKNTLTKLAVFIRFVSNKLSARAETSNLDWQT